MYADNLVLICETKEEARKKFVAWRNALESKGLKENISKTKIMRYARWCSEGGSSGSMQCAWKEGGCELNPLCNMWLLGAGIMFGSVRKFGESGRVLCAKCVEVEGERRLMSFASKMSSKMCW